LAELPLPGSVLRVAFNGMSALSDHEDAHVDRANANAFVQRFA